jgi:uncharacterized protein with FMN-binding domain
MKRDRTHDAPRSGVRIPNSLLALGSAAVLAVYSAGNLRTREAAQRFDDESGARRRPMSPGDAGVGNPGAGRSSTTELGLPRADAVAAPGERVTASVTSPATEGVVAATAPSGVTGPAPKVESAKVGLPPATTMPTATSPSVASTTVASPSVASTAAPSMVASPQGAAAPTTNGSAPTTPSSVPAAGLPATGVATTSDSTKAATDSVKAMWRDGTFSGWGTSRHGDIEATVVIEGGKITGASISRCLTRYSCSWIAHLQQQVVTRQSPEVDYVSGATQSANAFYYAVVDALQKAK